MGQTKSSAGLIPTIPLVGLTRKDVTLFWESPSRDAGYTYDSNSNRTRLTREDGAQTQYAYDALNRLVEISEHNRKYKFTYDPVGRVVLRDYPNGVQSQYAYEGAGRLLSLKHIRDNGALLAKFEYDYDATGNRTSMTDNLGTHTYGYDKLDRLTSAAFPSGRRKAYTYDPVGNRTRLAEGMSVALAKYKGLDVGDLPLESTFESVIDYTYDAADRILTAGERSFVHDTVGRLVEDRRNANQNVTFNYGGFDRPVQIAGLKDSLTDKPLPDSLYEYAPLTPTLDFGPAPLGARIQKTDSQGITKFLLDNTGNILAELKPDNTTKRQFVHTLNVDEPLAITDEFGDTFYMLPDGLGSVAMLTDGEGDSVQSYNYEPFGKPNVTAKDKNSLKFTAREFDSDSQLWYARARYLNSDIGRWLTKDPLISEPKEIFFDITNLQSPQTLNPCNYANNDPILLTDPFGLHSLRFDGRVVSLFGDDNKEIGNFPATSGLPGFMDPEFQNVPWQGPIPEGKYFIRPSEISIVTGFRRLLRDFFGLLDWGRARARLHASPGTNTLGRTDFFIHGGKRLGSAGCIDVAEQEITLLDPLREHKQNIVVTVDYSGLTR